MARRGNPATFVVLSLLVFVLGAGALCIGITGKRSGNAPTLSMASDRPSVGRRTTVRVVAREPKRGLLRVQVEFVQGERVVPLLDEQFLPVEPWNFWNARPEPHEFAVIVGRDNIEGLRPGPAFVRATAHGAGAWFADAPHTTVTATLTVRLTPPSIQVRSSNHYVAQGGAEVVAYVVGKSCAKDGVRVGSHWFPGHAIPGRSATERFAFFAVPHDMADGQQIHLVAEDDAGNEVALSFVDKFTPKPFKTDQITVTDSFMSKVVAEIVPHVPNFSDRGSLLANYLAINGEVRRANGARLGELAKTSTRAFLWKNAFLPMPGQIVSAFADRRTYVHAGETVDRQDHLGFDIASTQRAPIPASNTGRVAIAGYLGIFGNAVVLDHGFGLMSLYGHLSSIAVKEGDRVERGAVIGNTGATGLALGDHLHFTMLLEGLPVTPTEWWDPHWIRDRLTLKLGDAFELLDP